MKKSEIAMIVLVASICMMITFFAVRSFFGNITNRERNVPTIEPISDGLEQPSKLIFNTNAINPTVEVYVENDVLSGADGTVQNQTESTNQTDSGMTVQPN